MRQPFVATQNIEVLNPSKIVGFFKHIPEELNQSVFLAGITERELLSIVETLKEFRNILLSQQIIIHTDHENLTYKQLDSDRVLRWRLYIEEYGPEIRYVKGEHNIVECLYATKIKL